MRAGSRKKTPRLRKFFAHLGGDAELDGRKAAELAGYRWPEKTVARLRATWPEEFEKVEVAYRNRLLMDWQEVQEGIADVARTKGHKDRLKALELYAKIHGKLDPKLSISLDRTTIEQHLQELMEQMAIQQQRAAGAALVTTPPKQLQEPTSEEAVGN